MVLGDTDSSTHSFSSATTAFSTGAHSCLRACSRKRCKNKRNNPPYIRSTNNPPTNALPHFCSATPTHLLQPPPDRGEPRALQPLLALLQHAGLLGGVQELLVALVVLVGGGCQVK